MSGLSPALVPSHIFGVTVDSARSKHVHTLEDGHIAYIAGHNVVVYNPQTKQQRFLHGSRANEKSTGTLGSQRSVSNLLGPASPSSSGPLTRLDITAIAVSPNKRFIAVAERGERASILIYDARTLKKKKLLSTSECASREYLALAFSSDGKCLLSLSGAPGFSLINWQWEAVKPLDAIKLEFRDKPSERDSTANLNLQVSLSPAGDIAFVTGNRIVQAFRIDSASDFTFKPETVAVAFDNGSLEDGQCLSDLNFVGHCWVGSQVVMAADKGDLLLLEDLTKLSALPAHREGGWAIRSIEPLGASGAFVVGGQEGTVRIYEKQDSAAAAPFACARSYRVDSSRHEAAPVVSMAVSDSLDALVFTTANQQLYRITSIDTEARPEHAHTELLSDSFHAGEVTGLDVCVRKPLMVTCGSDRTVRVWNFLERSLVMSKTFQETPLSVALHPSGLHLLVGFTDKLRIMNLLMDDMRTFKELPVKNCGECRFSHGGQCFAAVMGSVIVVYSFYSCEILHTLRGHNGLVRSVYWTLDDSGIISAGMDGAVYERRLDEAHRRQEWVQKSCHYSSAVSSVDGKLYAVGDDRFLKEIQEGTVNKEMDSGVVLTQVAISHPPQRMLFVATESGFVRSFKFPLTGEFTDFVGHAGPVTRMSISPDDGFVFTTGADGCVCVFEVKERDGRLAKRDRADALPYAQEVLVTKTDLEEKTALMSDLKTQVEELTIHNAYQLRMHDIQFQDKLKEVTDQFNMQLEHNKSKYEMLKDERQDSEMDLEERVRTRAEQQALELQDLDNKHQITLMDAVKRYHRLEAISAKESREAEELTRTREQQHSEALARNEAEFQSRLEAMRSENTRLGSDRDLVSRKFTETRSQLEEDIDKEIEELKRKYEAKLHAERDATLRLKGENGIMKKKFSALKKDIEDQREEIKTMMEKEAQLQQHIETLEREIQAHKQQIEERDVTIGDKETEIYDLKKENQELEKFKFVLDYQIKELKRQIEPRENEIEGMKESVMRLDKELEQFHGENRELQSVVAQLKADLLAKHALSRKLRQQHRRILGALDALKNDIEATVRFLQDPNVLRDRVIALVSKHVTEDLKQNQAADPAVVAEYERQKQHLERTVATLKRDMESQTAERKKENTRILQENVALLKEINDLRKEMKSMRLAWKQNELKANMSSLHSASVDPDEKELEKMLELQRDQIRVLEAQLQEQEAMATLSSGRLSASKLANKVVSRERLLPMDDFAVPAHSLAS